MARAERVRFEVQEELVNGEEALGYLHHELHKVVREGLIELAKRRPEQPVVCQTIRNLSFSLLPS